jgi:hypothetical protein
MKKWMVRGKFNIEPVKEDKYWLENIIGRGWTDGQYLYYQRTMFDEAQGATLFKSIGAAKGKATTVKKSKTEQNHYRFVDDIEVVEVKILIPGEKNEKMDDKS